MKDANDNGINAASELSADKTHKIDNEYARFVLKKTVGKSENPDVEVLEGKQDLYFHNKKTGYGYFIHFD